ncbi:MAG: LTA synthase family protein [Lachnospiraceae bacterium]|nr:LTA synthase family protein [Lachnospiraceae bacterium]
MKEEKEIQSNPGNGIDTNGKSGAKPAVLVLKVLMTLLLCGIFLWFMQNKDLSTVKKTGLYDTAKIIKMAVLSILSLAAVWLPNPFRKKKRICTVLLLAIALAGGVLNFIGMELVSGDLTQLRHLVGLLNLIVIYFLMLTVFAATNRIKPAVIAVSVLLYVFTLGNYFTNLFRGIPILASDLLLFRTAMSVAGSFAYTISYDVLTYTMFLLLLFLLLARMPEQEKLPLKPRLIGLCGYAVLLGCFLYAFVFSNTLEKLHVSVHHFDPNRSYRTNGSILTFARSCQMVKLKVPDGYSTEALQELADSYIEEYEADTAEYRTPNVIVVMSEAYSDLQAVNGAFDTSVDVMPVIHSLSENTVKGTAYSSVFGGNTANSEYEFLTGHSMAFLNGVVPFQFLIKKPMASLTSHLSKLGYEGLLAIHPYNKKGYNRDVAYKNLGFSYFKAIEDMQDREHEYVRNRISDADDMQEVIGEYERIRESTDAPVCLYTVTMQNHSPYDVPYDNFSPDVEVLDEEYKTFELEQYLSLIKLSDAAFGQLIDYFAGIDEDTVIVFFGDHQPKLSGSFYTQMLGKKSSKLTGKETMQKYQIPYVIWANYDIEETDYGEISLNYLSAIMAESAGMKLTPYERFLLDLRRDVPVITAHGYWDKNHTFYEEIDEDSPYKELLDLYEYSEYNNLMDTKNRIENFFD